MHFKSGKFWSSTFSKVLSGAALSAAALVPVLSSATITVLPIRRSDATTQLGNASGSAFYYPTFISLPAAGSFPYLTQTGILAAGYDWVDSSVEPSTGGNFTSDDSLILFSVTSSNKTFTGSPVIVIWTPSINGTGYNMLVPIAVSTNVGGSGAGSYCENGNPLCFFQETISSFTYQFASNYTAASTNLIGISPHSICLNYKNASNVQAFATGCDTNFFPDVLAGTSPTATGPTTSLTLNFAIYQQTDLGTGTAGEPLALPSVTPQDGPVQITVDLENISGINGPVPNTGTAPGPSPTPTAVCDLTAPSIVQPKDSGLLLDGTQFSIGAGYTGTIPGAGILVADVGPATLAINTLASDYTNNSLDQTFLPQINQVIPNFTDSPAPPAAQITYKIGFLVQDFAGYVFDDHGTGLCTFPGVYSTSQIQGFLNSNKCFIATAAFQMGDEGPIHLLREFRDQFLERFSLGQSFVHWYYGWSPGAADWLIDHPVFRFPVLFALIPLQMIAWLILHPLILALFGIFALGLSISLIAHEKEQLG
jgi:hypothetical protein